MTRHKKFVLTTIALLVVSILIKVISLDKLWVEEHYSSGFYPVISCIFKTVTGWLPFSLGDILYGILTAYLFYGIFRFLKLLIQKKINRVCFFSICKKVTLSILCCYILFNIFWGINYNRLGVATQLGLPVGKYSTTDLIELDSLLLRKVNETKTIVMNKPIEALTNKALFSTSAENYRRIGKQYPFLNYQPESIKSSLWGWLGNYVGFLGYYNPFTGEAQVNTTVPAFILPFTSCHEIAHQLGYAKENEANFVGYLAATSSLDTFFHYSAYLDLFLYANQNLYFKDSLASKYFANQLLPAVKNDLKTWREFNLRHKNPIEPLIRWVYGKYLQNNEQPAGMRSYDQVTGFLVAYYKKYGKL